MSVLLYTANILIKYTMNWTRTCEENIYTRKSHLSAATVTLNLIKVTKRSVTATNKKLSEGNHHAKFTRSDLDNSTEGGYHKAKVGRLHLNCPRSSMEGGHHKGWKIVPKLSP